ncbi:hypothetical protein Tco_0595420 [Tanacetum coccineum]
MACSVPHTSDEIKAMVEKQIEEDKARQLAIMNLALHQLHLDEEALREILEEEARDEKEREEKIRQKQVDDEEYYLEFGVKYDSEYESD